MHEIVHIQDQASQLRSLMIEKEDEHDFLRNHVWAVTSGKGGVGKSVFALNMSLAMSQRGRKVLLVDVDENLGKLDIMMDVNPTFRLSDVVKGKVNVREAVINPFEGFYFLAGTSAALSYPEMTSSEREYLLQQIRQSSFHFTDVIFDTGAGVHENVVDYCTLADEVIVVTNSEPTTIIDAYAVTKMIIAQKKDVKIHVVMNAVGSPSECDEAAEKLHVAVHHFLNIDFSYSGFVPFDVSAKESVRVQHPLLFFAPNSPASLCLKSITHRLLQEQYLIYSQSQPMVCV